MTVNESFNQTVGVFDSGMGGLSVANAIRAALPNVTVLYREDKEHVPYGSRTPEEILGFVEPIFKTMVEDGCDVIVIACNTVTTTLIETLRTRISVPLVGIEPMIKPAAQTSKSGVIAVCATPLTLHSPRYAELKIQYADGITVLEPDCSDWATMIEHDNIDETRIGDRIEQAIRSGADVIVLACTHYHWIEQTIDRIARGRATIIQPERAIVEQLERVLASINT